MLENQVKELFKIKYRNYMKNVDEREWRQVVQLSKDWKQSIEEIIFNNCVTVSISEFEKDYGMIHMLKAEGYIREISRSHQETRYRLTKKGAKWVNQ